MERIVGYGFLCVGSCSLLRKKSRLGSPLFLKFRKTRQECTYRWFNHTPLARLHSWTGWWFKQSSRYVWPFRSYPQFRSIDCVCSWIQRRYATCTQQHNRLAFCTKRRFPSIVQQPNRLACIPQWWGRCSLSDGHATSIFIPGKQCDWAYHESQQIEIVFSRHDGWLVKSTFAMTKRVTYTRFG